MVRNSILDPTSIFGRKNKMQKNQSTETLPCWEDSIFEETIALSFLLQKLSKLTVGVIVRAVIGWLVDKVVDDDDINTTRGDAGGTSTSTGVDCLRNLTGFCAD